MPTYDYVCTKCGYEVEVIHGVHGHGPSVCPKCGAEMRKAFAPPALVFKGTGWARKERSTGAGRKKPEGSGDEAKASTPESAASSKPSSTESGSSSKPASPSATD